MKWSLKTLLAQICLLVVLSCSKKASEDPDPPPTDEYIELRVLEAKTNNPIEDAKVLMQKCANYDSEFGCTGYSDIVVLSTSSDGKCRFLKSLNVERIIVKHPKYWQYSSKSISDVMLTPEAFSAVHLKKVNSYPSDLDMTINVAREGALTSFATDVWLAIPTDTTIYLRSFGNYNNVIWWSIGKRVPIIQTSKEGQSAPYFVKAFDTTRVEVEF